MRLRYALSPLLGGLLAFHLTLPALASASGTTALTPTQAGVLKALGVPIVLPAVIPPGVKLAHVVARVHAEAGPGGGASYAAVYEGNGLGFAIESTSGGIGSIPGNPVAWFSPEALKAKKVPLYFQKVGDGRTKTWVSEWIEFQHHFFRLVGADYARQNIDDSVLADREVDASWAQRIAGSLRPVKL